jgi:AcrR family transcriptional regulator
MPAPTPSGARADARRQTIIAAALEVVRSHPVADVQLAAIAARAGMRPNHVLYYFGSRDDVLIETVRHAETRLAEVRSKELRAAASPRVRLARYVEQYLPDDRHDPVWKLWLEGWLRSSSHDEFGAVGREMNERWLRDLVDALEAAVAAGASLTEKPLAFARRFNVFLDGLALHVLAGHITTAEAAEMALRMLAVEMDLPR